MHYSNYYYYCHVSRKQLKVIVFVMSNLGSFVFTSNFAYMNNTFNFSLKGVEPK